MAAELKVKSGGSWRTIITPEVKYSGSWRAAKTIEVKSGGSWRTVYQNLSVIVAATKSISDTETEPTNAHAGVYVDANGWLYSYTPAYTNYEVWLDAGSNTQVWVQRSIISGTLSADAGSSRLACTSSRMFRVEVLGTGTKQCVLDLNFWDAASGGSVLDTQRVTLTAHVDEEEP